jgi:hypothetical protein
MKDSTLAFIRKIKTRVASSVENLWQPGLAAGAPDTILGKADHHRSVDARHGGQRVLDPVRAPPGTT